MQFKSQILPVENYYTYDELLYFISTLFLSIQVPQLSASGRLIDFFHVNYGRFEQILL